MSYLVSWQQAGQSLIKYFKLKFPCTLKHFMCMCITLAIIPSIGIDNVTDKVQSITPTQSQGKVVQTNEMLQSRAHLASHSHNNSPQQSYFFS